jgi:hypothetical protein
MATMLAIGLWWLWIPWCVALALWLLFLPPFEIVTRRQTRAGRARERAPAAWLAVESSFLDSPPDAAAHADRIVDALLRDKHPSADLLTGYQAAHELVERGRRGEASTDELRAAMLAYRVLYEYLTQGEPSTEQRPAAGSKP